MVMTDFGDVEMLHVPVTAERIVAVGHAGHVHLLDLKSGRTLWTYALAGMRGASACEGQPVTVGVLGEVVFAGSMGHVFAIRVENGELLWHSDQRSRGAGETNLAFGVPNGDYVSRLES